MKLYRAGWVYDSYFSHFDKAHLNNNTHHNVKHFIFGRTKRKNPKFDFKYRDKINSKNVYVYHLFKTEREAAKEFFKIFNQHRCKGGPVSDKASKLYVRVYNLSMKKYPELLI